MDIYAYSQMHESERSIKFNGGIDMDNKTMRHGAVYTCKRMRMLSYLKEHGFLPYATVPDIKNPKYSVWLFNSSPALEQCVENYFKAM